MRQRKIPKNFDGSLYDAVKAIADGNIGAFTTLTRFLAYLEEFTYEGEIDKYLRIIRRFEVLDQFDLTGERYWNFYKEICKSSHDNLFAFTQAYINHNRYVGVSAKLMGWYRNHDSFDFDKLFLEVKLSEPECFNNPVLIEGGEDKEITPDLLAGLKEKFKKS